MVRDEFLFTGRTISSRPKDPMTMSKVPNP
jgi:hypothetical protein